MALAPTAACLAPPYTSSNFHDQDERGPRVVPDIEQCMLVGRTVDAAEAKLQRPPHSPVPRHGHGGAQQALAAAKDVVELAAGHHARGRVSSKGEGGRKPWHRAAATAHDSHRQRLSGHQVDGRARARARRIVTGGGGHTRGHLRFWLRSSWDTGSMRVDWITCQGERRQSLFSTSDRNTAVDTQYSSNLRFTDVPPPHPTLPPRPTGCQQASCSPLLPGPAVPHARNPLASPPAPVP